MKITGKIPSARKPLSMSSSLCRPPSLFSGALASVHYLHRLLPSDMTKTVTPMLYLVMVVCFKWCRNNLLTFFCEGLLKGGWKKKKRQVSFFVHLQYSAHGAASICADKGHSGARSDARTVQLPLSLSEVCAREIRTASSHSRYRASEGSHWDIWPTSHIAQVAIVFGFFFNVEEQGCGELKG